MFTNIRLCKNIPKRDINIPGKWVSASVGSISHYAPKAVGGGGGRGSSRSTSSLLMLNPNLFETQIPYIRGRGLNGRLTIHAECRVQIWPNQNYFLFPGGGGGGFGRSRQTSQLLLQSPNLLKTQIPCVQWGWGGMVGRLPNFWCWVSSTNGAKSKFPISRGRGGVRE